MPRKRSQPTTELTEGAAKGKEQVPASVIGLLFGGGDRSSNKIVRKMPRKGSSRPKKKKEMSSTTAPNDDKSVDGAAAVAGSAPAVPAPSTTSSPPGVGNDIAASVPAPVTADAGLPKTSSAAPIAETVLVPAANPSQDEDMNNNVPPVGDNVAGAVTVPADIPKDVVDINKVDLSLYSFGRHKHPLKYVQFTILRMFVFVAIRKNGSSKNIKNEQQIVFPYIYLFLISGAFAKAGISCSFLRNENLLFLASSPFYGMGKMMCKHLKMTMSVFPSTW